MTGTLAKAWWLLALCGIADAIHAAINLLMMNPSARSFPSATAVWDMGVLALTAGVCSIAAGIWSAGKDHSWLLSLHGLALSAYGGIAVSPLVKGPLSFRPMSLLLMVTAASIGAFALETAKVRGRERKSRRFLIPAGAVAIAFACSFPAVAFLVRLQPPQVFFVWMSSYFVFCAMFMIWLAVRVQSRGLSESGPLPPAPNPQHAH